MSIYIFGSARELFLSADHKFPFYTRQARALARKVRVFISRRAVLRTMSYTQGPPILQQLISTLHEQLHVYSTREEELPVMHLRRRERAFPLISPPDTSSRELSQINQQVHQPRLMDFHQNSTREENKQRTIFTLSLEIASSLKTRIIYRCVFGKASPSTQARF